MPRNRKKGGNPIIEEKQNHSFGPTKSEPSRRRITMEQEGKPCQTVAHATYYFFFVGKDSKIGQQATIRCPPFSTLQVANEAVLF